MELIAVLVLVAVVALVVSDPLRRGASTEAAESAERAELLAARDAKYRAIRDAELDRRTGKLAEADWRVQDRALRAEAIELLSRLDALGDSEEADPAAPATG